MNRPSNLPASNCPSANMPAKDARNDAPLFSDWRAVAAPADFAGRVVALALAATAEFDPPTASAAAVSSARFRRRSRARGWSGRVVVGVALVLGAGAAAALSVGWGTPREPSTMLTAQSIERPVSRPSGVAMDTARSERNVGVQKSRRPNVEPSAGSYVSPVAETLLPVHLHVPPCQCTLGAVVCSCVE